MLRKGLVRKLLLYQASSMVSIYKYPQHHPPPLDSPPPPPHTAPFLNHMLLYTPPHQPWWRPGSNVHLWCTQSRAVEPLRVAERGVDNLRFRGKVLAPKAPKIYLGLLRGIFFLHPMCKILRILWRLQKWVKNTNNFFDPQPGRTLADGESELMGKLFLKILYTPAVYVQNDQRVMGIILRYVCLGIHRSPPSPTVTQRLTSRPPSPPDPPSTPPKVFAPGWGSIFEQATPLQRAQHKVGMSPM